MKGPIFFLLRFPSCGKIKSMIVGHTVAVSFRIIEHRGSIDLIFTAWKGNRMTSIKYKSGSERPALIQLVNSHRREIMCAVLSGSEPGPLVNIVELSFASG